MAGKRDRSRHFSMSFYSEIIVVAIKSHQTLDLFNTLRSKGRLISFNKKKTCSVHWEISKIKLCGNSIFLEYAKNLKLNLVLVLESKQIYFIITITIRIRATVNILRLHFFQTLCCFRRKSSRIMRPPSCTIHQTSTLPSKRSVLLGNASILRDTSSAS